MNLTTKKNYSGIAIICLLLFISVTFFVRCYYHEPLGDEVLYQYVWEEGDTNHLWRDGHRFERKITSFQEVIQSQILHYKYANGRSIVHGIEQAFTGHELMFSITETLLFLLLVYLFVCFVAPDKAKRYSYLLWLSVLMCLLMLFPFEPRLWTSINLGPNYLYPTTMTMGFLIIWERIRTKKISSKWNIPIAVFALIFGWSHEGFVVPLASATFLYYCFNLRKFRGPALWLCIPFWITASIMVFSPGNIDRFLNREGNISLSEKIMYGMDNMFRTYSIYIVLVGLFLLAVSRRLHTIKEFYRNNKELFLVLVMAILFGLIVNVQPRSLSMLHLLLIILIYRYIFLSFSCNKKWNIYISVIVTLLFLYNQACGAYASMHYYKIRHEIIEDYKHSNNSVYLTRDTTFFPSFKVKRWDGGDVLSITITEKKGSPYLKCFNEDDYEAIKDPDRYFTPDNKFSGNAPVYKSENSDYIWIHPDSINYIQKLEAKLYPVDWNHNVSLPVKIKFVFFPHIYPDSQILEIDTVRSQFSPAYHIKPLPVRKIKSINNIIFSGQ